jgi:apolipoprotein N-acyltransferase
MRPLRRALLLAGASGASLALAGPPVGAVAVAFMSPALLLGALSPDSAHGALRIRHALLVGAVAGTVANAIALWWVVPLVQVFARFPLPAALPTGLVLWAAQGMPFALAAGATAALARRGLPAWLTLPACLTVAYTLTPALFPWRPAASQVPFVAWVQLAEVGGEPLLDLLWAVAGCAAGRAALPRGSLRVRAAAAALAALAVAGPAAYGAVRVEQVRHARASAPVVRVGVVQPNVDIFAKHDALLWHQHLAVLQGMTRRLEAAGADVVVWPETAYPYPFPRGHRTDVPGPNAVMGEGVRGPLLFGAITQRGRCERWNSMVAMDDGGQVVGVADKVRLLAFGETVPLWHWLPPLQWFFACPGLVAGTEPGIVHVAGARIGVLNCYEDILAPHTRWLVGHAPNLLVNATNDAWFGDTSEPHLHHRVARLRSIETRRDLVRAVNTGVSGHVLATGEDGIRTPTWVRTSFVAEARLLEDSTPWLRFGDVTSPLLAGALLGSAMAVRPRRRRRRRAGAPAERVVTAPP